MNHNSPLPLSNFGLSGLKNQLVLRKKELEDILTHLENRKNEFPEGHLRIQNRKGNPQYYHVLERGDTQGMYIRKNQRELAASLAQKSYEAELRESIWEELEAIHYLLYHQNRSPESVYDCLPQSRKELVRPAFVSDEEYKRRWLAAPFEADPYYPDEKIHETDRGEFVRSKSELFIANAYYSMGIPYRYEARLDLRGNQYKYPDFTVLDVKNRRQIYHEHLGLLNKNDYRNNNLRKLNLYAENGILLGDNLIITFETDEVAFAGKAFKKSIKRIFWGD